MSPIAKALQRMYARQAEHAFSMLMLSIALRLDYGVAPARVKGGAA